MKKLLLIITLALVSGWTFGQNPFPKGRTQLNLGVGLSSWGVPIYFGIDRGVGSDFSIGGELSFRDFNDRYDNIKYNHSITGISGNANYHFNRILEIDNNWDLYAGVNLGFYIWSSPDEYRGNHSSELGLGAQLGARYYFSDKVGLNLEFGSGNAFSGGKIGVTIKI